MRRVAVAIGSQHSNTGMLGGKPTIAVSVGPNFDSVAGSGQLARVAGALLTLILIMSVLMLIVCAIGWAISTSTGNYQASARNRLGIWVSLGAVGLAGGGMAWLNFLLDLGPRL